MDACIGPHEARGGRRVRRGRAEASNILQISFLVWVPLRLLPTSHSAEEVLQFLEGFLGTFFLEEMAAIETAPGNR